MTQHNKETQKTNNNPLKGDGISARSLQGFPSKPFSRQLFLKRPEYKKKALYYGFEIVLLIRRLSESGSLCVCVSQFRVK
jgi:hypothetical protein